jgi:hypothetical protein
MECRCQCGRNVAALDRLFSELTQVFDQENTEQRMAASITQT